MTIEELIDQLRVRAADPARRVDQPRTELGAAIEGMDMAGLASMVGDIADDLGLVVAANQAGQAIDPDLIERADQFADAATTPVRGELPGVADATALDGAEADLGRPLPRSLRRIYGEVADGGFGPGPGLLPIKDVVATYRDIIADPPAPRGLDWPPAVVPLVHAEPGYLCVELPEGRVVDWDPQETSEWQGAEAWASSFEVIAADVETWLGAWVASAAPADAREAERARLQREELRRTHERIGAMTPEEREAIGLPAHDWEQAFTDEGKS